MTISALYISSILAIYHLRNSERGLGDISCRYITLKTYHPEDQFVTANIGRGAIITRAPDHGDRLVHGF